MADEMLEDILAPIPGDNPAGADLRYEGIYDRIQEARREDEDLPQGVWTRATVKKADWSLVETLCIDALSTQTKDLQIAVWLTEAWLIQHGVAGVKRGIELLAGLCEIYWESMYPTIDPDDPDYRLAPFRWMNEKLSLRLKQLQVTDPDSADSMPYKWIDWENARHMDKQVAKNQLEVDDIPENVVTTAHINASVILTPARFFISLHGGLTSSLALLQAFESSLDERLGRDAPSFRQFREVLKEIVVVIEDILRRLGEDPASFSSANGIETVNGAGGSVDPMPEGTMVAIMGDGQPGIEAGAAGLPAIRNRADAYRVLSTVADYLIRIEPHSPAPYLIKRAISWGSMPLGALLQELLDGNSDLSTIYKLLGIRDQLPQETSSSEW